MGLERGATVQITGERPDSNDFKADRQASHITILEIQGNDTTIGVIMPHKRAHKGGLKHGKYLARIWVNRDYEPNGVLKFRQGWNYWMIARRNADTTPEKPRDENRVSRKDFRLGLPRGTVQPGWISVYIPENGGPITVDSLAVEIHPGDAHGAIARWAFTRSYSAWGQCGHEMCCCGGECGYH